MPLFDKMNNQVQQGGNSGLLRASQASGNPWQFREANPNLGGPDFSPNNAYRQAIPQQAEDYDSIMQGFRDQMNQGGGMDDVIGQYNRAITGMGDFQENQYQEDPRFADAYGITRGLTETGGISEKDAQDLRARSTSPIRAVYANAKRGLERQKALSGSQGGANYIAASAKMARQQGEQTAGAMTNANAAIAEMRQKGILQSSSDLSKMGMSGNELRSNTGIANQRARGEYGGNLANLLSGLTRATGERNSMPLQALQGMSSLYAANPGLVETFGRQTQNQQQINNQNNQANAANRTRRALGAAG